MALIQQFRSALRGLHKSPAFAAVAVSTLALCYGANLTIFAILDAVLLRPLPFPEPAQLVTLYNTYPKAGVDNDGASIPNYYERRGKLSAFSDLALYREGRALVGAPAYTEQEAVLRITPDFLATLGARPALGRTFTEVETTPQADGVVMLSNSAWRQYFSSDPQVLGQVLRVDGEPKQVVGVLPPDFRFLSSEARFYLPLASSLADRAPDQRHSGGGATHMIGRLKKAGTLGEAQAQVDVQNSALEKDNPQARMIADAGFRTRVVSLHGDHVKAIRTTLLLMQAGVFLLLLIGCVNLMNLLLIRAHHRRREFAIRQAMGANLRQLLQQVIIENLVLSGLGGALGLGVGALGIRLLGRFAVERLPLGSQVALNGRLALVALAASMLTGFLISLVIAWIHLRAQPAEAFRAESRNDTVSPAAQRLRHGFIAAQIALAYVLLAGAGMLALSLRRAQAAPPGFQPEHTLTGRLSLPATNYNSSDAILHFADRLMGEVGRQPGVAAVAFTNNVPLSGRDGKTAVQVVGHTLLPGESLRGHYSYDVTGDYFLALGIPLQEGRMLESTDSHYPERVCVVDEAFARTYWPGGNALGQRLFRGSEHTNPNEAFTVVGVVGTVKQVGLTEPQPQGTVYFPYGYNADLEGFLVIRLSLRPEAFAPTLIKALRRLDPDLTVADLRSMTTRIDDSLVARRSPALLIGIFAVVALLLAALGTYGVLSYATSQRRREIGIRMALGAMPSQILAQFMGLSGRLLALGLVMGGLGAWVLGRGMESALFGVDPLPPMLLIATATLLLLVVFTASFLPALRAALTDPATSLRAE